MSLQLSDITNIKIIDAAEGLVFSRSHLEGVVTLENQDQEDEDGKTLILSLEFGEDQCNTITVLQAALYQLGLAAYDSDQDQDQDQDQNHDHDHDHDHDQESGSEKGIQRAMAILERHLDELTTAYTSRRRGRGDNNND